MIDFKLKNNKKVKERKKLAESGFDPPTCGLWARHASSAPPRFQQENKLEFIHWRKNPIPKSGHHFVSLASSSSADWPLLHWSGCFHFLQTLSSLGGSVFIYKWTLIVFEKQNEEQTSQGIARRNCLMREHAVFSELAAFSWPSSFCLQGWKHDEKGGEKTGNKKKRDENKHQWLRR